MNELTQVQTPKEMIKHGSNASKLLTDIITKQKDSLQINGKQYLLFHHWQTIARFFNCTVGVEWTKPIMKGEETQGYEARSVVYNIKGAEISSAESSCGRDEDLWRSRPDFQIKSMAQTRACAKALRNVFSWVAVLSGYEPTPGEEIGDVKPIVQPTQINPVIHSDGGVCSACAVKVIDKVRDFSFEKYGKVLCYMCQKKMENLDVSKPVLEREG